MQTPLPMQERENEYKELQTYFSSFNTSNLFIFGTISSGKTTVLKNVLETVRPIYCLLNANDCCSEKLIYQRVLFKFTQQIIKCENFSDFVSSLLELKNHVGHRFIIIDNAECLLKLKFNVIFPLLKLKELTGMSISVVFLSRISWEAFLPKSKSLSPRVLFFPPYDKQSTIRILSQVMKDFSPLSEEQFKYFVDIVYQSFHQHSNLVEMKHAIKVLFPLYLEPILSNEIDPSEKMKLFKRIQPHIHTMTHSERSISQSTFNLFVDLDIELSITAKYLLIASYLASYNPVRLDLKLFTNLENGKRPGKRSIITASGRVNQSLVGPKVFPIDRMVAIFNNIVEESFYKNSVGLYSQIQMLISLRLLFRSGSYNNLDNVKCKCNVSFDFVQRVAKSVDFDVKKYLYEFI